MSTLQLATQQRHNEYVTAACRQIELSLEAATPDIPDLSALAGQAGLSPGHFHRVFKRMTGLTPRDYAAAHRARRVREQLLAGKSVTETLYGAGFNSNGRFYEAADAMLGMKPADYRSGGRNAVIYFAVGQCSLGAILAARSERGVCAILLDDDPQRLVNDLQDRFAQAVLMGADSDFEQWMAKVIGFVEAPALGLDLPLDIRGTAFQQRVWKALSEIPCGHTISYAEIARRIGSPKAVRAVAGACAANALAVAIPCHRVVRSDGGLSGYRWGIQRKERLLERERDR